MPLDPDAQRVLDLIRETGRPPFETLTAPESREAYRAGRAVLQPDPPPVAAVRDLTIPGPVGPVPARLYRGAGTEEGAALPCLVYYHGGGWVIGDLDTHDGVCRLLANEAHCAVLSVDYRLAPEHRFPAAVDDSVAALRYAGQEAAALGIDPARLGVGGDSAGGNLAAVVSLAARDDAGLPQPRLQLLLYPATDFGMGHPSYERITAGFPLTTASVRWFSGHYLRGAADVNDWRASPLRAATLAGTPPAYVLTAGYDPLCDEGIAYARRLAADGVRVAHLHLADQIHGFLTMGRFIRASDTTLRGAALAFAAACAG